LRRQVQSLHQAKSRLQRGLDSLFAAAASACNWQTAAATPSTAAGTTAEQLSQLGRQLQRAMRQTLQQRQQSLLHMAARCRQ
jgi:exonuclease VII large subunit